MRIHNRLTAWPRQPIWTTLSLHSWTSFSLQSFPPVPAVCLDSLGQFKQIHHSEQRPTRSHNHERIHATGIGPACWYRLKAPAIVVKPNSVFAPVLTKCQRFEF